ncbi:MAG TPA: HAD-IIIA family hydrolase [Opitutaceae bacterium]|nr:HAD-IIIA family hydrolase [Opitutaceae bacterium]
MASPVVFLDRDGTLNAPVIRDNKPYAPETPEEFVLLDGVLESCQKLKAAGFKLVVATNQPDVGRGKQSREIVEAMHRHLCTLAPIDAVYVSYASGYEEPPDEERKPRPGMLLRAAREMDLDLKRAWMVGDRWRDIDSGFNAGVRTIFIDWNYDEKLRAKPDFTVRSFAEATRIILEQPFPKNLNPAQ